MNKRTAFSIIFLPVLLMGTDILFAEAISEYTLRTMNPLPNYLSILVQVILQGLTLLIMYRSLAYKKEKNYRIILSVMIIASILIFFLSTSLFIPFQLYLISPFLIAYYGSSLLYSLFSK
ncbi:hypothetical protein [Jeotgalibaca ciconiae]|uniref:Uncharacterized protein n=1 Tax=Jeotgalibaca ciconiae TaxID=2496265 RepID=A0A3S9HAA4_9LACT|nr:hypothetical protein [Jeotgalibaca ciconiae]AZP04295.1 hypothetical protein EJN90_06375 [Jeotgalibaca ciconiae]HJB23905.1 hypothetical protein [Candidatus Jeotgalibaca pullicola]